MILDTTAPAEELQDKLSALEQLLLAYGRVAIAVSYTHLTLPTT